MSKFNKFEPRLKSAKNRFQLSTGLNLETLNTILSGTNHAQIFKILPQNCLIIIQHLYFSSYFKGLWAQFAELHARFTTVPFTSFLINVVVSPSWKLLSSVNFLGLTHNLKLSISMNQSILRISKFSSEKCLEVTVVNFVCYASNIFDSPL